MENYVIEATLGGGAQAGAVLKVAHKVLKKSYVMKQIPCKQEKQAERALIEAQSLESLSHEYVCGYKERFSFWSEEEGAIIVCIVMDYYLLGDLNTILDSRRKEKKNIEEELIKKWLAQLVLVLDYIHSKKIIHRDLKPENIFIKNESLDLVIGDFGIVAQIGDTRLITRTAIGSLTWMAPEVTERPYDERSDLWSLGCILIALLTCHSISAEEIQRNLLAMKKDQQVLDNVLGIISKSYSANIVNVLKSLMKRNFQERSSAANLLKNDFVKSCVDALKRSKTLPTSKGIPGVVEFLKSHEADRDSVAEALSWLASAQNLRLDNAGERTVLAAMQRHKASADVSGHACRVFGRISTRILADDFLLSPEIAQAMTATAKAYPQQFAVQAPFLTFCNNVASIQTEHLNNLTDLVPCLLSALDNFPNAGEAGADACSALTFLCDSDNCFEQATSCGALRKVHSYLRAHRRDPECVQPALSLMMVLTESDSGGELAEELNLVHLLLSTLKGHITTQDIVSTSLSILESLVMEEQMARSFIECQDVEDRSTLEGIVMLMTVYEKYKDKDEIVAKILQVLRAALTHDDVAGICDKANVKEIVNKASKQHGKNNDVKECCEDLCKIFGT